MVATGRIAAAAQTFAMGHTSLYRVRQQFYIIIGAWYKLYVCTHMYVQFCRGKGGNVTSIW